MQSSGSLLCVAPHQVSDFWPFVEPMLKAATERCGNWSIGEIRQQLDKGALLWIAAGEVGITAALVTRLAKEKCGLVLEALCCGGDLGADWRSMYEEIEDYGRNEGCVLSRISGREGWRRKFKDYDIAWVTLQKRLDS